jgi:hypothetical protein
VHRKEVNIIPTLNTGGSVADPDPSDPHVFGPPGSGSFYH